MQAMAERAVENLKIYLQGVGKYIDTIFISGTASITDSETRHIDDAAAQTDETLNNIEALIGEENLGRHGLPGLFVRTRGRTGTQRQPCASRHEERAFRKVVADCVHGEFQDAARGGTAGATLRPV